jgi:hypothetical protein
MQPSLDLRHTAHKKTLAYETIADVSAPAAQDADNRFARSEDEREADCADPDNRKRHIVYVGGNSIQNVQKQAICIAYDGCWDSNGSALKCRYQSQLPINF